MTVLGSSRLKCCVSRESQKPNVRAISATSPLIPLLARVQLELSHQHGPTELRTSSSPDALSFGAVTNLSQVPAAFLLLPCGQEDIPFRLLAAGQPAAHQQIISVL